jgi:hypothetical protein
MKKKFLAVIIVWVVLFAGCSEGHRRHRTHHVVRKPACHQRVHHSSVRIGYSYRSPSHRIGYKRPPVHGKGRPFMHGKGRPGIGKPSTHGKGRPGTGRPSAYGKGRPSTHSKGKHGNK